MALDPLFKYIGAKVNLSSDIIANFHPHDTYIEVFGGGLSVFWAKPKSKWNIVNDINSNITNLYRVIQDEKLFKRFLNLVHLTPLSREIFKEFDKLYFDREEFAKVDPVRRAFIYYYLIKTVFNGEINTHTLSVGIQYTTAWKVDINIKKLFEAFTFLNAGQPVLIENLSYGELIKKYVLDMKPELQQSVMMYLDPPYFITDKISYYEYNFPKDEHEKLKKLLDHCKCNWMVSYDDVPEIRELYKNYYIKETRPLAQTSSMSDKKVVKRELLITNYRLEDTGLFTRNS